MDIDLRASNRTSLYTSDFLSSPIRFNKVGTSSSRVDIVMYNISLELNLTVISARLAQKGKIGKMGRWVKGTGKTGGR